MCVYVLQGHSVLFLAQQPATQPLAAIGNKNLDAHFLATNAHTWSRAETQAYTLFSDDRSE